MAAHATSPADAQYFRDLAEQCEARAEELRQEARQAIQYATEYRTKADQLALRETAHVAPKGITDSRGRGISERELAVVKAAVEQLQPITTGGLAAHLNVTVGIARKRLQKLEDRGTIRRTGLRAETKWWMKDADDQASEAPAKSADYKAMVRDIAYELTQAGNVFLLDDVVACQISPGTAQRWLTYWTDHGMLKRERIGKQYVYERPRVADNTPRPRHTAVEKTVVNLAGRRNRGSTIQGTGKRRTTTDPNVRALLTSCREKGLTVEPQTNGHYKIKQGERIVGTVPGTPSDFRSIPNARSDIRRNSGVPV